MQTSSDSDLGPNCLQLLSDDTYVEEGVLDPWRDRSKILLKFNEMKCNEPISYNVESNLLDLSIHNVLQFSRETGSTNDFFSPRFLKKGKVILLSPPSGRYAISS